MSKGALGQAAQFTGKSTINQHRMVRAAGRERMDDGAIHALSISTATPG